MVRLGVDVALHVKMAEKEGKSKDYLITAGLLLLTFAGVLGGVVVFALSDWLADHVFGLLELSSWLRIAAILVLAQCLFQFSYAILVGLHQYSRYATVMVGSAILNVFTLGLGVYVFGLAGGIFGTVFTNIFTTMWLARMVRSALKEQAIQLRFGRFLEHAAQLFRIGFPFYLAGLIAMPVSLYMQGLLAKSGGIEELARISHSLVKIRIFSLQDVNEPGERWRMVFVRANAPVWVLNDA